MRIKKKYLFPVWLGAFGFSVLLCFLLLGCNPNIGEVTPLKVGISLSEQYLAAYDAYNSQYKASSEWERTRLRNEVAPALNGAKYSLSRYNKAVLNGTDSPEARRQVLEWLRIVSKRMTDIEEEESDDTSTD